MKKYNCEYRDGHKLLKIGDNWIKKGILASNHKEAYEKFIQEVGLYPKSVTVSSGLLGVWKEFDDHIEAAKQRIHEMEKVKGEQIESQESKEVKQNVNLSTDELLSKIILNQNTQTESLNKIHWAIIVLLIFIVGQWIALKMKLGL